MDDSTWHLELVGSCDGLVCLSDMVYSGFVLYNLTTKEGRNLPGSDHFRPDVFLLGFGYDSRSDDYKIVHSKERNDFEDKMMVIFLLKSSSWRTTQTILESHLCLYGRGHGIYWKGALHWCVLDRSKEKAEDVIISFDLSEEKFQQILWLPEVDGNISFEGLEVHGANLFVYHGSYKDCFQAWITSEYGKGGSWTKLYNFTTEGISGYSFWRKIPVAYTRSGKIVFQVDVYRTIMFNPEDNTYKDYPIQHRHDVESTIYMETVISPYLDCEPSRI
ncbi:F-box protein CPR1 [Eucalyptus grandis]|nr:F-box protein CPR1 [Eucalyptus grandis]